MRFEAPETPTSASPRPRFPALALTVLVAAACATGDPDMSAPATGSGAAVAPAPVAAAADAAPSPDPRVGLDPGLFDAELALWNLELVSTSPPADDFVGVMNSDLAFKGRYAIQGNYNGFMVWDISDPAEPDLVTEYLCPASQSDVSVYEDLLFVSGEGLGGRLDCGTEGVPERVSHERLRGIRIFDISDIRHPEYIANVQTCRGSHTHSVLADPGDPDNVYIYVSGSADVRPEEELPGCSSAAPDRDPNTALFRIEVIRVPLANPEAAAIASSPRIFEGLVAPPEHGPSPADRVAADAGSPDPDGEEEAPDEGPTQCHDITLFPEVGLAGGACEGYGMLIDIRDPVRPVRIAAVADSNFAYWHSATFNNDGTAVLFTDEWGGGRGAKCRAGDPYEWGANAIFAIEDRGLEFRSYYKMPAVQTPVENCVAHNGSLIPVPGRDIMVQGWYQGGVSVFDWTDAAHPVEIAFFDRGPVDPGQLQMGGSWSAYWYDGAIYSSEIARGLDILELTPSPFLTRNEIEAARTARSRFAHFNVQGQQRFEWPATFVLARAYVDQLERAGALPADRIAGLRGELATAERADPAERQRVLLRMADHLAREAAGSGDAGKVRLLAGTVRHLAE